jgi:methylamine dehydrogenase light chain
MGESIFDKTAERFTRRMAGFSSRRGFLAKVGTLLVVSPAIPLLPVARAASAPSTPAATPAARQSTEFARRAQSKNPGQCDYWRYCAIDGILCGCCGGGVHTCPPGTEPSPITWVGTCLNPDDQRSYVIAYRDCCGKPQCKADKDCLCEAVEGESPIYRPQLNNDLIWCFGNANALYTCSTASVVGVKQ